MNGLGSLDNLLKNIEEGRKIMNVHFRSLENLIREEYMVKIPSTKSSYFQVLYCLLGTRDFSGKLLFLDFLEQLSHYLIFPSTKEKFDKYITEICWGEKVLQIKNVSPDEYGEVLQIILEKTMGHVAQQMRVNFLEVSKDESTYRKSAPARKSAPNRKSAPIQKSVAGRA